MKVGRGIRRLAARPARDQAGEAVSSPARGDRAFTAVTMAVVAFVAAIAASASYQHQYELAIRHGQARWVAAMLPFSVDGMIVSATLVLWYAARRGHPRRSRWLDAAPTAAQPTHAPVKARSCIRCNIPRLA